MNQKRLLILLICSVLVASLVASGWLFYQNLRLQKQISQLPTQPSSSSAATPAPLTDPTADWKTYTNTVYHFSVKYPSKFLESCDPSPTVDGIRFWKIPWNCPQAHDVPYVFAIIGYDKNIYRQFIGNITKTPVSSKTVPVAGINSTQNFYKYTNEDGPLANFQESTEIIIPVGINVIVIQQLGSFPEDKSLFNQILSTFKFTD